MSDRLADEPFRFTFFQAVRLLLSRASAGDPNSRTSQNGIALRTGRLGTVCNIAEEPVRFRMQAALGFAPAEIVSLQPASSRVVEGHDRDDVPVQLEVAFWGITGPAGALPNHYTQRVIDRVHAKDYAMRDFYDMFSHRQLSFFYRAWEKYFLPAGCENSRRENDPRSDLIRETLLSLVGRGTTLVRNRLEATDDACVYYGGLFVDRPTAESLAAMVNDYLELPVKVLSLFGQWLVLPPSERSRLGAVDGHSRMGIDTILGGRTWDPGSKFRIQIGPVTWPQFARLMPTGDSLVRICQFIRSYVGLEFDFDLQVILMADQIPRCQLASPDPAHAAQPAAEPICPPHLGWNTWLCSTPPQRDSDDAVFHHDGAPTR
ncbi:type VI secretion system baseplate subunit TssG [Stieleria sp. TO1_6]|uniref:type VI secretion system baseplate subunit TssG n=1 Tax=Stieleria tagensis TaxID=2956795 RepID=UPI00209B4150|nr:type VI secretion system baseplate subunit TssG [Stieleria tagensis]MCO8121092.1 type VI secretion system baseplate subunit TssG [Stieleria tagensis]